MSSAATTNSGNPTSIVGSGVSGSGGGALTKTCIKHSVHWFRKGLRLHDNPSLREAIRNSTTFRCIFIIDPWFAGSSNIGINKWRFLLQCLEDLDFSLRKFNSRLFVIRGQPADVLPKYFKEWGTTCLSFEEDPEPFGRVRDQNIMAQCKELNIDVIVRSSHTLYKLDQIIEKNGGKSPLTYRQFQSAVSLLELPAPPEPELTPEFIGKSFTPVNINHNDMYAVPTLEELGFETDNLKPSLWRGGESEAMIRLERHLERKAWVATFGRPKMTTQSLLASQTGVSPYLRFGCLSPRLFFYQLTNLYRNIKKSEPPLSLHGQLLWREFFYCAATKNANFDKMVGNPICVQIPWDKNPEALAKWANGQTGFPWIDAIMTQLREEGWIHHLGRHAVACFLTRSDLFLSWEEGMKVFDELLLDVDWSVNAGMWMWLSCSSFFQQFFHCYSPVKFGRKADPNGDFIRRYLPALKGYPNKYIHEPWTASEDEQKQYKCIVGQDYPLPMINHAVASRINIERMKQVYQSLTMYKLNKGKFKMPMNNKKPPGFLSIPQNIPKKFRHHSGRSKSPFLNPNNVHITRVRARIVLPSESVPSTTANSSNSESEENLQKENINDSSNMENNINMDSNMENNINMDSNMENNINMDSNNMENNINMDSNNMENNINMDSNNMENNINMDNINMDNNNANMDSNNMENNNTNMDNINMDNISIDNINMDNINIDNSSQQSSDSDLIPGKTLEELLKNLDSSGDSFNEDMRIFG